MSDQTIEEGRFNERGGSAGISEANVCSVWHLFCHIRYVELIEKQGTSLNWRDVPGKLIV